MREWGKIHNLSREPLGKYISQLYRKSSSVLSKKFSKYGIGYGQYMFLIVLYKQDGINQEEISERLNIYKGTTARAIKKLEEAGFVKRCRDEKDKRAYKVYLTDKAKDIEEEFFNILDEWDNELVKGITEEEILQTIEVLKSICKNQNTNWEE